MERKALNALLAATVVVVIVAVMRALKLNEPRDSSAVAPARVEPSTTTSARPEPDAPSEAALRTEALPTPASAPRAAEAPSSEPDTSWIVDTPPSVLEVQVFDGDAAAGGALVEALSREFGGFEYGEPLDATELLSGTTDEQGFARWSALPNGTYDLRVTLARGARALRFVELADDRPSTRIVVRLGNASIAGTVFDGEGRPLAGARLWLTQTPRDWGSDIQRWALSDLDGSYRIDGLAAGSTLLMDRSPDSAVGAAGRHARLELGPDEERQVDLGTPGGAHVWRGRLLLPSGALLREALTLSADEVERGWHSELRCDAEGAFEVALQPGSYLVRLRGYAGPTEVARVAVGNSELALDVVVPATCVRIAFGRPAPRADEPLAAENVSVRIAAEGRPDELGTSFGTRGSHLVVPGVPAGSYRISVDGYEIRGHAGEPVTVVLDGSKELVELALDLTPTDG